MRTRIAALALLLAAQLALAAYLGFGRTGAPPATAALSLPAAEAVETITIAAAADEPAADRNPDDQPAPAEPVSLLRREGRWALAEPAGLPADAARVDSLLTKLAGLRPGLPVADSKAARRRFAVADDHYERRITLQTADGEQVLYLGTPAGTRRTHLRTAGDEAIHLVPLALYEVPADADGWLDKTLLQLPAETIEAIDVAGLRLTRATPPIETDTETAHADAAAASALSAASHGGATSRETAAGAGTERLSPRATGGADVPEAPADDSGRRTPAEPAATASSGGAEASPPTVMPPGTGDTTLAATPGSTAAASAPEPGAPETLAASDQPAANRADSNLQPPNASDMPAAAAPAEAAAAADAGPARGAAAPADVTAPAAEAGSWRGVPAGETRPVPIADAAADDLARRIAGLRVAGLARQAPSGEPVLHFSVTRSDGSERTYRLFAPPPAAAAAASGAMQAAPAAHADYRLTVSDRSQTFRVPGFLADSLREAATRQQLLATGPANDAKAEDNPAAP